MFLLVFKKTFYILNSNLGALGIVLKECSDIVSGTIWVAADLQMSGTWGFISMTALWVLGYYASNFAPSGNSILEHEFTNSTFLETN